jgi:hypothetical protein
MWWHFWREGTEFMKAEWQAFGFGTGGIHSRRLSRGGIFGVRGRNLYKPNGRHSASAQGESIPAVCHVVAFLA